MPHKIHVGSIHELRELAKKKQLKEIKHGTKEEVPVSEARLHEICEELEKRGVLK